MSNRLFYVILCIIFLIIGGSLYLIYRENAYITILFDRFLFLESMGKIADVFENDFFKFYFPDFLWGLSLNFGLFSIFLPKLKGALWCSLIAFLYGMLWETMQKQGVLSGTGDLIDILMYLLASVFAMLIFIMRRKENEKNY